MTMESYDNPQKHNKARSKLKTPEATPGSVREATVEATPGQTVRAILLAIGLMLFSFLCAPVSAESSEQCRIVSELQASTYYSTYYSAADTIVREALPVGLGQAIVDDSSNAFSLPDDAGINDAVILAILGLSDGTYTIHFGSEEGNDNRQSYSKTVSNGSLRVLKSEVTTSDFSFVNRAEIGISGPGIEDTKHVATYYQSNIYNHYDLQAMRQDLTQDYVLKKDIEFPSEDAGTSTVVSNYEAIGNDDNPFMGSLDGAGHTIAGIQIESPDGFQGIFGAMEANVVDTVIAQNLVLKDFKITGRNNVGSLVGRVKRGTVNGVHMEVSTPDTGYVRGKYSVGGLVGWNDGTVEDSYATGSVRGTGLFVGGLVGYNANDGTVTGYATGDVTGRSPSVGGLVGWNSGAVSGYATGSVIGNDYVGGLAGSNGGTVTGYATGSVESNSSWTGGLVGYNYGIVTGYATGSVTGNHIAGGLVGYNGKTFNSIAGVVIGYARGIVRRADGASSVSFGKTIGENQGIQKTYSSSNSVASESKLYNGASGTTALTGATGVDGTAVSVTRFTQRSSFSDFVFSSAVGEWTWVNGKWPAINIGSVKPTSQKVN